MFCPRCGTQNEAGDRFCSSCGASLRETSARPTEPKSFRDRVGGLIGTTRRARLVTVMTAVAILVAIAAFIALDPAEDDDEIPRDAYTLEADGICVDAKRRIVAVERRALADPSRSRPAGFAGALVSIVADWRADLQSLVPPADRIEQVSQLDAALLGAEIELAGLALIAAESGRARTLERAKEVDTATARVEEAISSLGLRDCSRLTIGLSPSSG